MADYDKVLTSVGEFGTFQKRLCVLMFIVCIPNGLHLTASVFSNITPNHRCAVPGLINDSYTSQDPSHKALVHAWIPKDDDGGHYSNCKIFSRENTDPTERSQPMATNSTISRCHRWVYDEDDVFSQVVEFDLVCSREIYKAHGNMMLLLGMLVGSLLGGMFSDIVGRKTAIIGGVVAQSLVATAMAFVHSIKIVMAIRFFLTVMGCTSFMAVFVMLAETVGTSKRSIATMASMLGYTTGLLVVTLVQYLIRDWRTAQIVQSLPFIGYIVFWWLIKESPRWLLTKNKQQQANDVIAYIAKVNKVSLPQELKTITDAAMMSSNSSSVQEEDRDVYTESGSNKIKVWHICKTPKVVFRIAILCLSWVTINLVYYGLVLGVGDIIEGDIYVNFALQATMEIFSHVTCVFILERTSRKRLFCSNMILSGLATLGIGILVLVDKDIQWLSTILFCLGKFSVTIGFNLIYIITTELLPTKIRNSGLGFCSFVARFSGIVSPYIVSASLLIHGPFGKAFPVLIFGVLSLTSGLSAILLPETKNARLPEAFDNNQNSINTPKAQAGRRWNGIGRI